MHMPPDGAGITDVGLKPRPIRRIAVLGGGLMGSGIATAAVLAGLDVLLKEINQQFLEVGDSLTQLVSHTVLWGPVRCRVWCEAATSIVKQTRARY